MTESGTASTTPRRVVLIGFMGAGKSTVGRLVARGTGWRHVDFDEELQRRTGRTVPAIFAEGGEAAFRRMERALAAEWLAESGVVLSPGGGWVVQPGSADQLGRDPLVVWLRVSPEEAVRRVLAEGGDRPLLAGTDPVARARELLRERAPIYEQVSHLVIDVNRRSPDHVAREILRRVRPRPVDGPVPERDG